jgi:hypothetical protein
MVWPQCLADIAVQRVDNNLLAAVAEARVPRSRFVKEGAAVTVFANRL